MTILPERGNVRRVVRAIVALDGEYQRLLNCMGEILSGLKPESILDVGCGDGSWSQEIASRLGVQPEKVHGIEISPSLVSDAQSRLHVVSLNLESERWPFPDQSIDLVVVNQVLEHLKNVHWCLAECERVLAVGGHQSRLRKIGQAVK